MGMTWEEICADPILADLPFKIESDQWGNVVMSPPAGADHSDYQSEILVTLARLLPAGLARAEYPSQTNRGVKAIDVAWVSRERHGQKPKSSIVHLLAPEICVEVFSPRNSVAEIEEKILLLHGDLKLAQYEQDLASAWVECFQRKSRGLKSTSALSTVVKQIARRYKSDIVLFDVGPNIGPLNRAVLLDCDYFVIPAACDLFSVRALTTLGVTIANWVTDWRVISSIAPQSKELFLGQPKFLGYIPQRFRVYRGVVSSGHAALMSRIQRGISSDIMRVLRATENSLSPPVTQDVKLGEVKDFGQMVAQSQVDGEPIWRSSKGTEEQKAQAQQIFHGIARKLVKLAV